MAAAAAVTQLWKAGTGKGQCWAQVVYRSCQNATMPLTQAFHSRVAGQLSPLSCLSILNLWQEAACHPSVFGWDAAVGSSVCFSREAELFFSVTLLPGPELAVEVLWFSVALAEEEVLVGKVLKKLPKCVEASTLHMQISAVLFPSTLFSSILCFTYC